MAIVLTEHKACGLAFELSGKGTALFGHQTPLSGEHSHLNECLVSLDHYTLADGVLLANSFRPPRCYAFDSSIGVETMPTECSQPDVLERLYQNQLA